MVFIKDLVGMYLRIRLIIVVLACVGIGIAPQLLWGESHHRLAKAYADKNDAERAAVYYGLALQNAPSSQIAGIASDYAAFLMESGDLHKAELMLRQALSQSRHDEQLIKTLARCLVLQDKVIEGLRYYKSVGSEAEAKEEIAAIYREKGNSEMVAAVEHKWGTPKNVPAHPALTYSAPAYMAAVPKPVLPSVKVTVPDTAARSTEVAVKEVKPSLLPAPLPVHSKPVASQPLVAADTPSVPLSKSELFDTRIPIPVPGTKPLAVAKNTPMPIAPVPPPLPAPKKRQSADTMLAKSALTKSAPVPVEDQSTQAQPFRLQPKQQRQSVAQTKSSKFSAAPLPTVSDRYTAQSSVPRQSKHYLITAGAMADLDALFPVKPVAAIVPSR